METRPDKMTEALRRVDARLAAIDEKIRDKVHGGSARGAAEGEPEGASSGFLSRKKTTAACTADMWDTSDAELGQLMAYVTSSSHVTTNTRYAQTAAGLSFQIDRETNDVNAYASVDEDGGESIVLLGGMIRMANLLSAAYVGSGVVDASGNRNDGLLVRAVSALGRYCLVCKGAISPKQACRFALRHGLHRIMGDSALRRKAKSFSAGMITCILAHELGHLALGHCCGEHPNLEVSRNTEREADSFASSVISSSPFGDYLIIGSILCESVWVWVQNATGAIETTHPLARERLADLIRANPSTAAELGMTADGSEVPETKEQNLENDLTRDGSAMSAPGAQFEREVGRKGQAPAICPETIQLNSDVSSVADRPSLSSFVTFDIVVRQLAKARVRAMSRRRQAEFSASWSKGERRTEGSSACAEADYLPPRNAWKRPPAAKRRHRQFYQIAEQSILRTVRGFRSAGALEGAAWGRRLLQLVSRLKRRIAESDYEFHRPKLILKRKDAVSFRCLASYADVEDKLVLNCLFSYLRNLFDPFIVTQCHSFRLDGKKSHHSAVRELIAYRQGHPGETLYVAECDIMKFFDAVDHREILRAYDAFVEKCGGADPQARILVEAFLRSYTCRENVAEAVRESPAFARDADKIGRVPDEVIAALHPGEALSGLRLGIPQGGAVSPLFANILLSSADEAVLGDGTDGDLFYMRFCDDMIIAHTNREKCAAAMDRYLKALLRLKLPVHPHPADGFAYGESYYALKSKGLFEWRDAQIGERNAAPWVSFLGYQVNVKGEVRVRKETLEKHKTSMKAERARLGWLFAEMPAGKGRVHLVRRYCRHLVSKGVGRMLPGAIRENVRCWAAAFPNLAGRASADCRLQMRSLDVLRERLLRFPGNGFMKASSGFFLGRPFSYLGYLLRIERPSLRTLRRKKKLSEEGDDSV